MRAGEEEVPIFVSPLRYYSDELLKVRQIVESRTKSEVFCLLEGKERCPKGAVCFKGEVDWWRVREYLTHKHSGEKPRSQSETEEHIPRYGNGLAPVKLTDQMISHLSSLYPDSQAMVEYLDFMGISPEEGLLAAGFKVVWKGLRIVVRGKES